MSVQGTTVETRQGYQIVEQGRQSFEVIGRSGKVLARFCGRPNAQCWIDAWVRNGYRDDFYNLVGDATS